MIPDDQAEDHVRPAHHSKARFNRHRPTPPARPTTSPKRSSHRHRLRTRREAAEALQEYLADRLSGVAPDPHWRSLEEEEREMEQIEWHVRSEGHQGDWVDCADCRNYADDYHRDSNGAGDCSYDNCENGGNKHASLEDDHGSSKDDSDKYDEYGDGCGDGYGYGYGSGHMTLSEIEITNWQRSQKYSKMRDRSKGSEACVVVFTYHCPAEAASLGATEGEEGWAYPRLWLVVAERLD